MNGGSGEGTTSKGRKRWSGLQEKSEIFFFEVILKPTAYEILPHRSDGHLSFQGLLFIVELEFNPQFLPFFDSMQTGDRKPQPAS